MAFSLTNLSQPLHYPSFPPPTFTKTNTLHSFQFKIKLTNQLRIYPPSKISQITCSINHHYALLEDPQRNPDKKSQFHCGISTNMLWAELRAAFGQRFNLEGIICSAKVITKDRNLLLPHVTIPDIRYINWDELYNRGFKGVIFDKDNTLTLPYSLTLNDPLRISLEHCKAVFGENNVAILSNSAGLVEFDPDEAKARALERRIGLKVIRHRVKKPAGDAEEVEKQLGCRSTEVVMVGDRRFTDAVYGNRNGFLTVLTMPLSGKGEPFIVRRIRNVEDFLVRVWYKKGLKPISHCSLSNDDVYLICLKEPLM